MSDMEKFEKELTVLINKHSMENGSDTPDYILAHYLCECLTNINTVHRRRSEWYGMPHEVCV